MRHTQPSVIIYYYYVKQNTKRKTLRWHVMSTPTESLTASDFVN